MKKNTLLAFTCILFMTTTSAQRPIDGLAHRILGGQDTKFVFVYQPDTVDYFQIETVEVDSDRPGHRHKIRITGTDHIYGVDPFNEMDPPSWEPDYLATVARNIYTLLQQSDTEVRWLQMTYKRKSWTSATISRWRTKTATSRRWNGR